MDYKRIVTVTYSDITSSSLTVTVGYDDGTFVTDHPVLVSYTHGEEVLFDFPERIIDSIKDQCKTIMQYTRDYETSSQKLTTDTQCHCGAAFYGSDHCSYCYCEKYESYCAMRVEDIS
jgi:hypothetical protein